MSARRNLTVDAIRLAAAFGVIFIHLAPSTNAAEAFTSQFVYFAVPFFLSTSLYFFLNRVSTLPSPRLSGLRLDRILVPYVVWTVTYTVLRLLKMRMEGKPPSFDLVGTTLFGGGAVQLYFLPLLLLFQAMALAVIFLFRTSGYRLVGLGVGVGALAFGYWGEAGSFFGFEKALARGCLYVALAFLLRWTQSGETGRRVNVVVGWLSLACILSTAWLGHPLNALGVITQGPVVGYGMSALGLNLGFQTTSPVIQNLLTCSYGIYLAHVAFLESCEIAAKKSGYVLTPYTIATKVSVGGLICLCCVVFILVARLHWLPAYLLFGETLDPARQRVVPLPAPGPARLQ